tara:strand:+ start:667 stop:1008 length:342 start_codon:yes stop_codon:yes gene_type:complete
MNNNNPQLNFDMISKILNMRMEIKKEERISLQAPFKKQYTEVMNDFLVCIRRFKHDMLCDEMGYTALYGSRTKNVPFERMNEVLDGYELWETETYILSPVEEDDPYNSLNLHL